MKNEIGNISIQRIREINPGMKGIGMNFVMDRNEHRVPPETALTFHFPLRLDGIILAVRLQGKAHLSINLHEYDVEENDLTICAPGDIIESRPFPGVHQALTFLISSSYLKEMYIDLNSLIPFYISQKQQPIFHLTEQEVNELTSFYSLIEEAVDSDDYFRNDVVQRLMGAYLYKLGSILRGHQPEQLLPHPPAPKREEVLFKEFINLLRQHHRQERRVDFYAQQLFLSPKHFSSVVKKVSGKTAGEWIDEYVILEAKTLLKYSELSIQEVAYFLNFSNPSFFGKYFKHHTQLSPSEYKAL